jgi:CRISPR-associated endonuclease/helicase Cas3
LREWKTIATHAEEVVAQASELAAALGLDADTFCGLRIAALWHDVGKSHPAFQGAIASGERPDRQDLAKAPESAWRRRGLYRYADESDERPGFRHELASALALFALLEAYAPGHPALLGPWAEALAGFGRQSPLASAAPVGCRPLEELLALDAPAFNLAAYLVASHHGKVRVGLHAAPKDQEYRDHDDRGMPIRGVRERDQLPAIVLEGASAALPRITLTLEPAAMGLSERTGASWQDRVSRLLARYGPCGLAFLEAVMRAADVRASRLETADRLLAREVVA